MYRSSHLSRVAVSALCCNPVSRGCVQSEHRTIFFCVIGALSHCTQFRWNEMRWDEMNNMNAPLFYVSRSCIAVMKRGDVTYNYHFANRSHVTFSLFIQLPTQFCTRIINRDSTVTGGGACCDGCVVNYVRDECLALIIESWHVNHHVLSTKLNHQWPLLSTFLTVGVPWQNLSKSIFWDKVSEGGTLILELSEFSVNTL